MVKCTPERDVTPLFHAFGGAHSTILKSHPKKGPDAILMMSSSRDKGVVFSVNGVARYGEDNFLSSLIF